MSLRFAAAPPSPPGGRTLPPEAAAALAERTLLYALMNTRRGTHVVVWEQDPETGLLALCRHTRVSDEPSSCFDVSPCGKLLAVGTSQSSIVVSAPRTHGSWAPPRRGVQTDAQSNARAHARPHG